MLRSLLRRTLRHLATLALLVATAHAQTDTIPPRLLHQWTRIADLPPGTPLLVQETYNPHPTPCTLAWIDNTALACDIIPFDAPRRVIYPATSIQSVRPAPPPHYADDDPSMKPFLIGAGIGGLLIGIGASQNGTQDGFVGALLGAGLGGGMAAAISSVNNVIMPRSYGMRIPLRTPRMPLRGFRRF